MTIVQHSSITNEHYTPLDVVEGARSLLGSIDLDPASCIAANERVKATCIFSEHQDGLVQNWFGKVLLNPPGGKMKKVEGVWQPLPRDEKGQQRGPGTSSMVVWWDKLVREWVEERVKSAVFIGFTLEILRSSQADWCACPVQKFPRCYPFQRMKFGGTSPTHANVIVFLPPLHEWERGKSADRLRDSLGHLGYCEAGS
jgi:hypothetical protein